MSPTAVARSLGLKSILFATDFSDLSENTLPLTLGLARYYEAMLTFFHLVTPTPASALPVGAHGLATLEPPLVDLNWPHRNAEHAMSSFLRQHNLQGLNCEVVIREGRLGATAAGIVRERKADLAVVASEGRKGFGKLLFGSAAEEIIRSVSCPVLTFGPGSARHLHAGFPINRVVCAVDFSPGSDAALRWGGLLAEDLGADLVLVHVERESSSQIPSYGYPTICKMQEAAGSGPRLDQEIECALLHGSPAKEISRFVQCGDVLVMGASGIRSFTETSTHLLGGTAHRVICSSSVPVFVVPYVRDGG